MGYADDTVFLEAAATRTIHQSTDLPGQVTTHRFNLFPASLLAWPHLSQLLFM